MECSLNKINIPKEFNEKSYDDFINDLVVLGEQNYLEFNKKITFSKYEMLGIRVPVLREVAKTIAKGNIFSYLNCCKRKYFEEILLEGFVISYIKDYENFLKYFFEFLPYVDNWAVCDMCISSFKVIGKNKHLFKRKIDFLLHSKEEFYVRVGIVILIDYYVEKDNLSMIFNILDSITRTEYYIEMAMAWLLSICFIKYPAVTEKYLGNNKLNSSVINKTIQKIRDSKRVDKEVKDKLACYKK